MPSQLGRLLDSIAAGKVYSGRRRLPADDRLTSQRATVAAEALPMLEAEAKERQAKLNKPQLTQKVAEAVKGEARAKAAKLANVNSDAIVSRARKATKPQ